MKAATLDAILGARSDKRPVVLATLLATGEQHLIELASPSDPQGRPDFLGSEVVRAAREASRSDRSTVIDTARGEVFLQVFNPPSRLIVVGAVHIAQALCPMASLAGFAVTVVDPRTAFASEARFPGVELSTLWPDQALDQLALDRRTAVVTLTHDPKLDEPALTRALASEVFYIGALGSKRTQAGRLTRLARAGFADDALARIHGPVGLDIGARSAAEIAVSILGEIVQVLRGGARRQGAAVVSEPAASEPVASETPT